MGSFDLRFPWIDANDCCPIAAAQLFARIPDGGDGGTGAHLDYQLGISSAVGKEFVVVSLLPCGPGVYPRIIPEHEDIWASDISTTDALWKMSSAHSVEVYGDYLVIVPYSRGARFCALQMMYGSMYFQDAVFSEARFLELAVNIGRDNKIFELEALDP